MRLGFWLVCSWSAGNPLFWMTYKEAIDYLYSLRLFGTKLGLEHTFRLAELAGNPQQRLRFIHVAGTNGKGSTCAMLESIYRTAGLKTGLFTSPHLVSFCERIQVDRVPISQEDVVHLLSELQPLLKQFAAEAHPTFFEVVTVMALKYFAKKGCDLVIWETGLGGRLDSTNIVTPLASVITNVQFDHQQWLGQSLRQIAMEKAGIIKAGIPVISGAESAEAIEAIRRTAAAGNSALTIVNSGDAPAAVIQLPLLGEHQRLNAALALETVSVLQRVVAVSPEAIQTGLRTVNWPGRLQRVSRSGNHELLLDGAHNVDGAKALRKAIEQLFPQRLEAMVLGMLRDKDCEAICEVLAPLSKTIYVCPVESERSADAGSLAQLCSAANPAARVVTSGRLSEALDQTSNAALVLLTGSLYFVGEALELLHLTATPAVAERSLNEWSASNPQPAPSPA